MRKESSFVKEYIVLVIDLYKYLRFPKNLAEKRPSVTATLETDSSSLSDKPNVAHKNTVVREWVTKPGYGDTKR